MKNFFVCSDYTFSAFYKLSAKFSKIKLAKNSLRNKVQNMKTNCTAKNKITAAQIRARQALEDARVLDVKNEWLSARLVDGTMPYVRRNR